MGFLLTLALIGAGAWLVLRLVQKSATNYSTASARQEEYERLRGIIERDPSQAGSMAALAELHHEDGEIEQALHWYRSAVRAMPHGPFTEAWKRHIKRALRDEEAIKAGRKIKSFDERACPGCQALISINDDRCPHCGEVISMGVIEYFSQRDVARSWLRETLIVTSIVIALLILLSALPIEWKVAVLISAAIVMFFLWRRMIDGSV